MELNSYIHHTMVTLMPGVPLYVYMIKGVHYSILIDTGIYQMKDKITELISKAPNLKNVLITHAHADHIGCNATVKSLTGAQICAAGAISWIENLETHYQEFCIPSEDLPDTPEQRAEIMGLMDGAVHVDIVLNEGTTFRPSEDIELITIPLPGHKLEEVAFLETNSCTLFMGDVLLALAAPFFHGFQTARGFRDSLTRLTNMIEADTIKQVLAAHHDPLDQQGAIAAIKETQHFLDEVEEAVIETATGITFPSLWRSVCDKLHKQYEFRGYAMLQVQVEELCGKGILYKENDKIFRR